MGTSLWIKRIPLGPYRRLIPRVLGGPRGGRFLMGEVPLYGTAHRRVLRSARTRLRTRFLPDSTSRGVQLCGIPEAELHRMVIAQVYPKSGSLQIRVVRRNLRYCPS